MTVVDRNAFTDGSALALLWCVVFTSGCSKLVPVEGTVVMDGNPLPGATVVFIPVEKEKDASSVQAATVTDAEGHFRLDTVNRKGALPGKYKVTVSWRVLPAGVEAGPANSIPEALALDARMVEAVPQKYRQQQTTPLEVEVPPKGTKDLVLELRSK